MESERPSKKQKRTRLNLEEKLEVARLLKTGTVAADVMLKFGISRRTCTLIKKDAEKLLKAAQKSSISLCTKTMKEAKLPKIDAKVMEYVTSCRNAKTPVTLLSLQQKALAVRAELLARGDTDETQRVRLEKFSASRGWVDNFVKRHALRSVPVKEERTDVRTKEVAADDKNLKQALCSYDIGCIYTVEETFLFFKLLPRRTYVVSRNGKTSVRGIKGMDTRDRITAYICANADGSSKVPIAIIGTGKNPRCFRLGKSPLPYLNQKKARSDAATFRQWFLHVFLPHVRGKTSKRVALIVPNACPRCTDLKDMTEQVNIFEVPPSSTGVQRPMDMGVIASWKQTYRSKMLDEMSKNLETRAQSHTENKSLGKGMQGIAEGSDPHLLDVANLAKSSWDTVQEMAIALCWLKADILPPEKSSDLNATLGGVHDTEKEDGVQHVMEMLLRLSAFAAENEDIDIPDSLSEKEVKAWLDIERDGEVQEAVGNDELLFEEGETDVERAEEERIELGTDDDENREADEGSIPSVENINKLFKKLEDTAVSCNLPDASAHLLRAKAAFLEAHAKSRRSTNK